MTVFGLETDKARDLLARAGETWRRIRRPWSRFWRIIALRMPKGLYARSLLIVITPMILLQSVIAFVFMERHWQLVTHRLSTATSRDIAAVVELVQNFQHGGDLTQILRLADKQLSLDVSVLPPGELPDRNPPPLFSILDRTLSEELRDRIDDPFWVNTRGENPKLVEVRVKLPDKVLRFLIDRSQTYASNAHIFLVWMVGTSIVLLSIAIPFLRNQVKPIAQLAEAAESFGKGRPPPEGFRPRGAEEVRRAGFAFNQMRERIERQIETRTAMLAGVSHDLRTILTRFRLQLAMGPKFIDADALNRDVDDMQSMLQGYMDFAKGDAKEPPGDFDMEEWSARIEDEAELRSRTVSVLLNGHPTVHVRPNAFGRLLNNVVGNAFRYAGHVSIAVDHTANALTVVVDDDGPGIPPERREDVFKPFVRLDEARNLDSSGTGLGLSIARDIARSHGGDIVLDASPLGGLRATIRVPA